MSNECPDFSLCWIFVAVKIAYKMWAASWCLEIFWECSHPQRLYDWIWYGMKDFIEAVKVISCFFFFFGNQNQSGVATLLNLISFHYERKVAYF